MVELLLKNGADVSIKDTSGRQPLHRAAQNGFFSIAQLLVSKKAEVNAADNNGWAPLHCAVSMDQLEITEYLLKNGANINALTSATPNESGRSPLHIAMMGGNVPLFELLLKYKPDVNLRDSNGLSPVTYMFYCSGQIQSVKADLLELLLSHGADVNSKTRNGDTPLFLSIKGAETECVKILLAHKADLEMRNAAGDTPLLKASEVYAHKGIAEMLVQAGADVNAVWPSNSQTPLFYAIGCFQNWSGNIPSDATSLIEMLVAHKANVNFMNAKGATPLTLAKNLDTQNAPGLNPGGPRPLPPWMPGRSSQQEAPGMTRTELASRIVTILKNAGANEAFERLNRIEITRGSETLNSAIFSRQGTNDWNRYSLLEVIARTYTTSDTPGVYGQAGRPMMPSTIPLGSLPGRGGAGVNASWPDFKNVRITRWDLKTGKPYEIPVDVELILNSGDSSKDVWLEWGDAVEIPEADHKRNENWPGLSLEQSIALFKCLQRDVTIIVKGEATRRTLVPFYSSSLKPKAPSTSSFSDRLNTILKQANAENAPVTKIEEPKPEPQVLLPKAPFPELASFRLKEVIDLSKLLRTSSDTTRVKVKRPDPLTRNREFVLNLEKIDDPSKDLWLRNGDVIEIPEK
jgi:ankyrin repeat protein